MKSLLRWSTAVGLVGNIILGAFLTQILPAEALPREQIVEKLRIIPVYTIADAQGAPLVASGQNNERVAGVFISKQDAQAFVTRLQTQNQDLASKVQVVPISLAEVYQLAQENEGKQDGLNFAYVPEQDEVESAKQLLSASGEQFAGGVPLFVARGGQNQGYLTIEQNSQQVVPFFFEKQQILQLIERFKQSQPDLAATVKIDVVPLEAMLATLEEKNDELLTRVVLIPSQESIEFIRQSQQQNGNQNGNAQPPARPSAPAPQTAPPRRN
ncbi:MAG: hypothetical protein HC890_10355 [Chloroflexaceae bacterium]|nr:hypothetical protein [Chloroflexaceae bacterium]